MGNDDELTAAEMAELQTYIAQQQQGMENGLGKGHPMPEKDKTIVGFFRDLISKFTSTTRAGNLSEEELDGVRQYLDTAHYATTMGLGKVGKFLDEEAAILTDTSLSKGGFLVKAAIREDEEDE